MGNNTRLNYLQYTGLVIGYTFMVLGVHPWPSEDLQSFTKYCLLVARISNFVRAGPVLCTACGSWQSGLQSSVHEMQSQDWSQHCFYGEYANSDAYSAGRF